MNIKLASGKDAYTAPLVVQSIPFALDPAAYEGSWVYGSDKNMYFSNGEEWYPAYTIGAEAWVPPWEAVPYKWFTVNATIPGDLSNRVVIANKFDLQYLLTDVSTWPVVNPIVMYTDSAGTIPVLNAPEAVGLLEDSTVPQLNWFQDVNASRPVWQQLTRNGETVDYIEFDRLGQQFKVTIPALVVGTMVHVTSYGIYRAEVSIPAGTYNYGRWDLWDIEEIIVFDRTLTDSEFDELKLELIRVRNRLDYDLNSVTNWNNAFNGRTELVSLPVFDTSGVTIFDTTWLSCSGLTSFPLIDTSSGTNFRLAWQSCSGLTSFPLIDTSLGTNFQATWNACSSLTSFPLIDTSSGTNFTNTWRSCSGLTSFPLLDTSSGTNFFAAWRQCSSLTSFPLLDTSSGTNFNETWLNCNQLTSFPLINTSAGTNFQAAWQGCNQLTSFPLINTSSGTNFASAWIGCSSLTSFPLIDTSSGTTFNNTWYLCSSLTSFPLIDTSSGTNFQAAWRQCSSLTSFPLLDTSSGTNFLEAWIVCSSLTSFPLLNISNGTNFREAWSACPLLADFPAGFFDTWTGVPVANCFFQTWNGCASLTPTSVVNILTSLDTSGVSAPATGKDITISYAGGDISAASTAITNLKSRSWTVTINGVPQ